MILTYQYSLSPTSTQEKKLSSILESQRQLYNAALQERIDCYQKTSKTITLYDQYKSLTQIREEQDYNIILLNIQRWTLKKLDDSFKAFFRRVQIKHNKAGFPRFRGLQGWHSFGFNEFSGIRLLDNQLIIKNACKIKIHLHRSLPPDSEIKSCVFTYTVKGWKASFQLSIPDKSKVNISTMVGLDLGLKELITLSTGKTVPNIRTTKEYADLLRRRQRKLSRCKLKSNRRKKVKKEVLKVHHKITNVRKTYLHQVSAKLVRCYDLIGMEKLQVSNMVKNHNLAKSIHDVSWAKLTNMIVYKAERAGKHVVLVDPRYTSQTCSRCGHRKKMPLSERIYSCDNCGLVIDRDHNAAINILNKAVVSLETHNVMQWHKRVAGIRLEEFQYESLPEE